MNFDNEFSYMILQALIGNVIGKLRTKTVAATDQRVKLMNEVLNCIKLIKMYAWEGSFAKVIGGNIDIFVLTEL